MGDFFNNLWGAISLLVWSDWLTLFILSFFVIRGFSQGFTKELISLAFLILATFFAWFFYESAANTVLAIFQSAENKSVYGLVFGIIVLGLWLTKRALYKLTKKASNVSNPCALNSYVSIAIFLSVIAVVSWNYVDALSNLEIMRVIIDNNGLRTWTSFVVIYAVIFLIARMIVRILNITVGTSQPCLLGPLFERVLSSLNRIYSLSNAYNIAGIKNKIFGAFIGLLKGGLSVLIIVLILQSFSWVSQQYFWIDTQGALRVFQNWSVNIKPSLSAHLLFVELEPGDVIFADQPLEKEE